MWKYSFADNGWADHTCSECGYVENADVHVGFWDYCPVCGYDHKGNDNDPLSSRKKGTWIVPEGSFFNLVVCSSCEQWAGTEHRKEMAQWSYCPNCGSHNGKIDMKMVPTYEEWAKKIFVERKKKHD